MTRSTSSKLLLAAAWWVVGAAEDDKGCTIIAAICRNYPEFNRTHFRDNTGEAYLDAGGNEAACLKRAEDFHYWCGNGVGAASVAAAHGPTKWSQVYVPGACEKGWSQWDAFCYKHYWQTKTWWEAEAICREKGAHLVSIHSHAENRFVYQLTHGLSAWIGYTDIDQDTHYKWSDNTQDDFTNFCKNCTKEREKEPECKPEEKKQQWYDWQGDDAGTYVCKRNALLPISLLKNVTAKDLVATPWDSYLPLLAAAGALDLGLPADASAATGPPALPPTTSPELKVSDVAPVGAEPQAAVAEASSPELKLPEPRLGLPKGSLL